MGTSNFIGDTLENVKLLLPPWPVVSDPQHSQHGSCKTNKRLI